MCVQQSAPVSIHVNDLNGFLRDILFKLTGDSRQAFTINSKDHVVKEFVKKPFHVWKMKYNYSVKNIKLDQSLS